MTMRNPWNENWISLNHHYPPFSIILLIISLIIFTIISIRMEDWVPGTVQWQSASASSLGSHSSLLPGFPSWHNCHQFPHPDRHKVLHTWPYTPLYTIHPTQRSIHPILPIPSTYSTAVRHPSLTCYCTLSLLVPRDFSGFPAFCVATVRNDFEFKIVTLRTMMMVTTIVMMMIVITMVTMVKGGW